MQTHHLLIIIAFILAVVAGYTAFLVLRRESRGRSALSRAMGRQNVGSIPDSPTYRRTKEYVTLLREALDAFAESLDMLSQTAQGPRAQSEAVLDVFRTEVPIMREALLHARNHGEALLAAVQQRASEPPLDLEVFGGDYGLEIADVCGDTRGAERMRRYLRELRETIESVGPGIAGFYIALTEQNERHQIYGASRQVRKVLDRLDYAIDLMTAFSREFIL